jgi:acid phosphatase family membrane protein YuiD
MGYNPYILIPLATWAIAQVTKFALAAFRGNIDFRYLYASGGMPSVHSAVVCSLAITALLVDGADSHIFGLTLILAAIVMYDSFGVRRSSGEQAAALNMLIDALNRSRVKLDQPSLRLREILGHQPREVAAGALLGVVLAAVFNNDKLSPLTVFLEAYPPRPEVYAYGIGFVVLLVVGLLARFGLVARYRKSKAVRSLASRILVLTQTIGWIGLISTVFVHERASYMGWRLWPLLIAVVGVIWAVWLATASYKVVPEEMAEEADRARKQKWLNWGKRRAKK